MNKQNKFFIVKGFVIAIFCFLIFSNAFAADSKTVAIIAENLSRKLKNDLAKQDISVKFTSVHEYKISANQVGIKGDGVCLISAENNQLPIRFDAKLDTRKQSVSDIKYDFVEPAASYAPTSNEEILMQELMKRISKDYGTQNIVIAIDGYEDVSSLTDQKEFAGVGEVRIGDFVWNKIKFDVVLNPENKAASKIVYKVEKK